jgi:hypothetical protein
MVDHDVVANDCGCANYGGHAVVDEESSSNRGGRVNLDSGEPAAKV